MTKRRFTPNDDEANRIISLYWERLEKLVGEAAMPLGLRSVVTGRAKLFAPKWEGTGDDRGSGTGGWVFDTRTPSTVCKLSNDLREAALSAVQLQRVERKNRQLPGLAQCYGLCVLKEEPGMAVIWKEKLEEQATLGGGDDGPRERVKEYQYWSDKIETVAHELYGEQGTTIKTFRTYAKYLAALNEDSKTEEGRARSVERELDWFQGLAVGEFFARAKAEGMKDANPLQHLGSTFLHGFKDGFAITSVRDENLRWGMRGKKKAVVLSTARLIPLSMAQTRIMSVAI